MTATTIIEHFPYKYISFIQRDYHLFCSVNINVKLQLHSTTFDVTHDYKTVNDHIVLSTWLETLEVNHKNSGRIFVNFSKSFF